MQQAILNLIDSHIYGLSVVNTHGEPQEEYHSEGQLSLMKLRKDVVALGDGWIPVTERLPTEYGRYMTYASMLEPHYIIYFDGNEWVAKFPEKITHWMPLPLPPKQ